jgi:site-specific DNA-cytosine methylase
MKINNVLSLFDGISCGAQALKDSNVKFNNYYSSEVDKSAIKIALHNHPEIIPVGDVRNLIGKDFKGVDLIIGGSPCQNFSFCGTRKGMTTKEGIEVTSLKQYLQLKKEGFEFEGQSYLFWEFVRLVKEIKPKYFLLENVRMDKKWEDLISEILGVKPVKINSSRVVPQNRFRNYWTNIPTTVPEDRSVQLSDFIRQAVTGVAFRGVKDPKKPIKTGKVGYTVRMQIRKDNIANAIITSLGNAQSGSGTGHYLTVDNMIRTFKSADCEILQGLPEGYTDVPGVSENKKIHALGNGWTVPVIAHIFNGIS